MFETTFGFKGITVLDVNVNDILWLSKDDCIGLRKKSQIIFMMFSDTAYACFT